MKFTTAHAFKCFEIFIMIQNKSNVPCTKSHFTTHTRELLLRNFTFCASETQNNIFFFTQDNILMKSKTHQSRWDSESLFADVALIWIRRLHLLTSIDIAGAGRNLRRVLLLCMRFYVTGVSAFCGKSHVALITRERFGWLLALIRRRSMAGLLLRLLVVRCQQLIREVVLLRRRRSVHFAIRQIYQLSLRRWHLAIEAVFTNYHLVRVQAQLLVLRRRAVFRLHYHWHRIVNHFLADFCWRIRDIGVIFTDLYFRILKIGSMKPVWLTFKTFTMHQILEN